MKVYFNRQIRRSPYGGGAHFLSGYADYLIARGISVTDTLEPGIDIIYMLDPRAENHQFPDWEVIKQYKRSFPQTRVIHRINDTDKARGLSGQLEPLMIHANQEVADATVFISEWVKNHYLNLGYVASKLDAVIINGCNEDWFFPKHNKNIHKPVRLVTHHWSDNPNKGADVYEYIDKVLLKSQDFEFTYVGRYNKQLTPTNVKVLQPLYGLALGDELRRHDIYVTGARWEACGMHHIEGAACGLPVICHADGGGVLELVSSDCVFRTPAEFAECLTRVINTYETRQPTQRTLSECCESYLEFSLKVLNL